MDRGPPCPLLLHPTHPVLGVSGGKDSTDPRLWVQGPTSEAQYRLAEGPRG